MTTLAAPPDWRRHWYPIAFSQDLGRDDVQAVTLHDEPLALFRDAEGRASIVADRCPHRGARLSDGRVDGGRLECLYHGWQFAGDGACEHIPQWPASQEIPGRACVPSYPVREAQGIIWLWPDADSPGDDTSAAAAPLPTLAALDADDCTSIDFAIDLPYEQTFLVENVIDIAHIHVAHDGVRGGGHRHLAAPMDFQISERTATGFHGSFRSVGQDEGAEGADLRGARVEFVAPNLVHYTSLYADDELVSGLALYSLPLGRQRCRLIYRAYSNFWPRRARWRPRWLEHWTQCTILEQDMDVVVGQAAEIQRLGRPPKELWLPLKSSDGFVLAYRRWLDTFAADWPHGVGFRRLKPLPDAAPPPSTFNRLDHHTRLCSDCSRAERRCRKLRTPLGLAVVALLGGAAVTAGSAAALPLAALAVAAAGLRAAVDRAAANFR